MFNAHYEIQNGSKTLNILPHIVKKNTKRVYTLKTVQFLFQLCNGLCADKLIEMKMNLKFYDKQY